MSTDLTPMKRFATNLKTFRSHLGHFTTINFNKSAAKNSYYHMEDYTTKGVANDYVLVFQSSYPDTSLGFSFQFMNLPVDDQYVLASIKKGIGFQDITYSEKISLRTFKKIINEFNAWAQDIENKTNSIADQFTIFNKFSELFLLHSLDMKKEVESKQQAQAIALQEKNEKYNLEQLKENSLTADNALKEAQQVIFKEITNSKENKELERITLEMHKLQEALAIKTQNLHKELKLTKLMKDSDKALEALEYAQYAIDAEFKYEQLNPATTKDDVKHKMR